MVARYDFKIVSFYMFFLQNNVISQLEGFNGIGKTFWRNYVEWESKIYEYQMKRTIGVIKLPMVCALIFPMYVTLLSSENCGKR